MAIDQATIELLKEKLIQQKNQLTEELNRFAKPTEVDGDFETQINDMGDDEDENASEVEEYADNLALEANLEGQLKEVNGALERLSAGTYGKCEKCEEDIDIERLKAYPSAKTCVKCN